MRKFSKINILFGPPGAGKTYAGEQYARQHGMALVFYQCHNWTSADDLFVGVDVRAAVAGEAEQVRQPGVLAIAAEKTLNSESLNGVVLLIDELDKAPESAEALLLDFLQSGRVPVEPGKHLQADMDKLVVFITTNEQRPHSDALLRRCKRFFFNQFPPEKISEILASQGYNPRLAYALAKAARYFAGQEGNEAGISLQEIRNLCDEVADVASYEEFLNSFVGWVARSARGAELIHKSKKMPQLWGNIKSVIV